MTTDVHIVIMGGGGVGKTALTAQFVRNEFRSTYEPTMEDLYRKTAVIDDQPCSITIVDTAGTEQFLALKELYIRKAQGFVLVFSLTDLDSVNDLDTMWGTIQRMKKDSSGHSIPVVLVGNKSDLKSERKVPREIGTRLSKIWGNVPYYETSARKRINVDQIFADLIRQIRTDKFIDVAGKSDRCNQRLTAKSPAYDLSLAEDAPNHRPAVRRKCFVM